MDLHDDLHDTLNNQQVLAVPDLCASNPSLSPPLRLQEYRVHRQLCRFNPSDLRDIDNLCVDSANAPLTVSKKIKLIIDSTKQAKAGLLGDLHDDINSHYQDDLSNLLYSLLYDLHL